MLAISIGFGLTIPQTAQDALLQSLIMKMGLSPEEVQHTILQESLSNYVFILSAASAMLIVTRVYLPRQRLQSCGDKYERLGKLRTWWLGMLKKHSIRTGISGKVTVDINKRQAADAVVGID